MKAKRQALAAGGVGLAPEHLAQALTALLFEHAYTRQAMMLGMVA